MGAILVSDGRGMLLSLLRIATISWILGCVDGSQYSLTPPARYVVFSGDLSINYTMPGGVSLPHAFVRLDFQRPGNKEPLVITTMGLTLGKKSGNLRVACGVIEFAGTFSLKMFSRAHGDLLTETSLDVRWPEIVLSLPDEHEAQTTAVDLQIISKANCTSVLRRHYLLVRLYFQQEPVDTSNLDLSKATLLQQRNFTKVNNAFTVITLGCHLFDLDGYYQAVMVSSSSSSPIVAKSYTMSVKWSTAYHLLLRSRSHTIFPCVNSAKITYTHPSCSGKDKIRAYSLTRTAEGSFASPLHRQYIEEKEARPDETQVTFQCSVFNQSAAGFCFVYVSVTRKNSFTVQRELCVSARPDSVFPQDGGWSTWTPWTSCSVTCGTGKQNRYRICNDPAPKHGGRFCEGEPMEWTPCKVHCPESIPRTPLHSPPIDKNCACGCSKTEVTGEIIATGRCHGLSAWLVEGPEGSAVSLRFDYFNLNYTRQWVKIRNGGKASDDLLFSSTNKGYPAEITSGRVMRVEFMTFYVTPPPAAIFPKNASLPIHAHGFIASYNIKAIPLSSTATILYQYEEKTLLGSAVTIVGIVICVAVILVAVIFVVLQRTFFKRRIKYSMTMSGESPAHANLKGSTSEHQVSSAQSSSSPSSPGAGIHVDMDVPLTGKTRRKNSGNSPTHKQGRSGRTPSISSTSSQKVKRHKGKGDGSITPSGHSSGGTPKMKAKNYSSSTNPYGIEIIDTDDPSVTLKTPSAFAKSPRAARIQSLGNKHSPVTPLSPISKLDLLNKKRHEKDKKGKAAVSDIDREVTGSSGSSTQRSRTPSTTKAEVNWPHPGFVRAALNEVGRTFSSDKYKNKTGQRPPSEEIPLIESYSSQESPSHINDLVKSDSVDSATTSFNRPGKARRPTSLTESYSNDVVPRPKSRSDSMTESAQFSGPIGNDESSSDKPSDLSELTKPVQSSASTAAVLHVNTPETVPPSSASSTSASTLYPRPRPPVFSAPRTTFTKPTGSKDISKQSACEERQAMLPKPDGQSPKPPRHQDPTDTRNTNNATSSSIMQEPAPANAAPVRNGSSKNDTKPKLDAHHANGDKPKDPRASPGRFGSNKEHFSPGKLSKTSSKGSKTTVSSPARSITTPSEVDGLELEYDDFIEDDPLSYFDYEQTQKLAFRGVEKIGNKTPVEEEEEEDEV
ncbi:uncharacterized protein LOC101850513 [Aplysia californica]|uniref:Uncharacterized protein LOC101850513 n=1 Tax=Aplysia californica TaxID=6500 RepID=A0ABM0K4V9_APLCA|nr:uncharacterized protein LOC101850513 [Aplysia californica]